MGMHCWTTLQGRSESPERVDAASGKVDTVYLPQEVFLSLILRTLIVLISARRNRFIAAGDVTRAYGASRDLLWYTLAFCACLRKKEVTRLRRRDITASTVPEALDIHITTTKNNQTGARYRTSIDGLPVGEVLDVHLALIVPRVCGQCAASSK